MLRTVVKQIGEIVPDFKEENLLILFGPEAPPELKDISVIHEVDENPNGAIVEGGVLEVGSQVYQISKVGSLANKNFEELGHLSIYFNDDESMELLPGAILVSPAVYPEIQEEDSIIFKK
ncbi:PTS glucitol/sorbitol transporter subunit IIA [Bacillus mesophilum]|uniref:PTS sorbitol transporter subunit IIA n=1 Tax=Bacillus mesophilum TaxID=1071718 RepID=A0A7V7RHY6_9BACI|nr:PTS glucitol/sorbitol transporter subunit IIA [Bacillus mesophilum]KAB2329284.1 PTS sorbitol transporter subunit IIA [Bacillus mesophilum]